MTTETNTGTALVERAQQFIDSHEAEVGGEFGLHLEFDGVVDGCGLCSSEELQNALKAAKAEKDNHPHRGPWTEADVEATLGNHLEYALRCGFELGYTFANQDRTSQKGLVN